MSEASDIRALQTAARKLVATGIFQALGEENFFLLDLPGHEHPLLAHLLGGAGFHTALHLYRGPGMLPLLEKMIDAEPVAARLDVLGWSTSRGAGLTRLGAAWLKKAKINPVASTLYADPMAMRPGRPPRVPDAEETSALLHATLGLLAAADDDAFAPAGLDDAGEVLVVRVAGTRKKPTVEIRWEAPPARLREPAPEPPASSKPAPATTPFDLGTLGHSGDRWQVGTAEIPGMTEDGEGSLTFAVLLSYARDGAAVPGVLADADADAVMAWLGGWMTGEAGETDAGDAGSRRFHPPAGRPASIDFTEASLAAALRPALDALGVRVGTSAPNAAEAVQEMLDHVMSAGRARPEEPRYSVQEAELGIDPENDPTEAGRRIQAFLDDHYDRWLDQPLPALDGATPREAAAAAPGSPKRRQLDELLEEMRPPNLTGSPPGFTPADPAVRVRAALGL